MNEQVDQQFRRAKKIEKLKQFGQAAALVSSFKEKLRPSLETSNALWKREGETALITIMFGSLGGR